LAAWLDKALNESTIIIPVILTILFVVIGGNLLIKGGDLLIKKIFEKQERKGRPIQAREKTLISILQSCIRYGTYFIMGITILEKVGVPVMAILSTAGVLGVGIAFGAQSLFKDIITGFFILMEDQYAVGEYIEVQGAQGYVEKISLRCTYMRDFGGQLHIVPNGNISLITNHHRGNSRALVDMAVSYDQPLKKILDVLENVCIQVNKDMAEVLVEDLKVWGILRFDNSALVIRLVGRSKPLEQWGVEKYLRKMIKEAFDREGLEIPYPHTQILLRDSEKDREYDQDHDKDKDQDLDQKKGKV
jgi:small-conductance mechanosensitive channel